ncbi:MAG: response regulator [Sulfurimonas sp.]|jgi:hypothetical protein
MSDHYKGCLGVLAHKKHIAVFDDNTTILKTYPKLLEAFNTFNCYAVNDATDEHLTSILTTGNIDAVIIESRDAVEVIRLCKHILRFDWKIAIVVIVPEEALIPSFRPANAIVDTILCRPITEEMLVQKMVTALAAKQTIIQLSLSLGLESLLLDQGDIETFKRTFEGNILLLCETLYDYEQRLKSGELSPVFFGELADVMEKIAKIFEHHHYTSHIAKIFDRLALYLRSYNFEMVDFTTLEGFDYLTDIVNDIIFYMKNFFVNRIFTDVYVFEHSLENSIQFMKNRLENKEDTQSEMEFFDD